MPYDGSLELVAAGTTDLVGESPKSGSFVSIKGGMDLEVTVIQSVAPTGTSPTWQLDVELSTDGSTAEGTLLRFAQLSGTEADQVGTYRMPFRVPTKFTHMRATRTLTGTTASYTGVGVHVGKATHRTD